jgi:tetratricopeptide (TPR) repeat protein
VARAYVESGNTQQARRTLESLISANPSYADAYDVMGRVQIEQGDLQSALQTFRNACELTPGSVSRLQKHGMMAFYAGESEEAEKALDRATLVGISSKMYDHQTLVLLAFLKFDAGDVRGLLRTADNLAHALERAPDNARLQRFDELVRVLRTLVDKQLAQVVLQLKDCVAQIRDEDFDFEAATNLIGLLVRVLRNQIALPDGYMWISKIAERFCVSKAATDLLSASAQLAPAYAEIVREAHGRIGVMSEQAMTHSVRGSPANAVRNLVKQGRETLNAKLVELARLVLQRHQAKIDDAARLREIIDDLLNSHCSKGTRVSINEHGRLAGSVALRA